jgi:hypothetical protein
VRGVCEIWNLLSLDENIEIFSHKFIILIFIIILSEPTFFTPF